MPADEHDPPDGLEAIQRIANKQRNRIERMMAEECETGVKYSSMSKEIHALTALVKALTKAKEWELVHGGADLLKGRRLEQRRQRFQRQFAALMDTLGDDGRNRLLEATERFMQLAEEHAITVKVGPDGKYTVVEPDEDITEAEHNGV